MDLHARSHSTPHLVEGRPMPPGRHLVPALGGGLFWVAQLGAQQPTGTIRGHVTDAATQQPLSAATVAVGSRATLTQTDGRFVLTGVPAGTESVRARLLGYAPAGLGATGCGRAT